MNTTLSVYCYAEKRGETMVVAFTYGQPPTTLPIENAVEISTLLCVTTDPELPLREFVAESIGEFIEDEGRAKTDVLKISVDHRALPGVTTYNVAIEDEDLRIYLDLDKGDKKFHAESMYELRRTKAIEAVNEAFRNRCANNAAEDA